MEEKTESDVPQVIAPPIWGSCRLTAALMCCVASFGALLMTMNLGMVIVCINKAPPDVNDSTTNYDQALTNNCTNLTAAESSRCQLVKDDVFWDKREQGLLLGATYYGVVSMQLLVGWLSDKFGRTKLKMIIGSTVMGVASLLAPFIIMYMGVPFFFAVRILMGAGMCFVLSPVLVLLGRWSTSREQGLLVGVSFAGVGLANALTYPISGLLCEYVGWRSIFYFSGSFGILWAVLALFIIYDSPRVHPRVGSDEKQYLLSSESVADPSKEKKKKVIPWAKILLSIPVWSVIITNVFFFGATKGTSMTLPIFVRDVLDFTVTENGIFSALPSVAALIIHLIVGPLFDYVRAKNYFSVTIVRKIFTAIGTVIPGVLMFAVSQLPPEQKYLIMILITIGYSLYEVAWMGGFSFSFLDSAPDYVGILQGINNTIGLAPGFIMPVVISALTADGTSEEWSHVFMMFGGLYMAAFLVFTLAGSSELQSWGKVVSEKKEEEETDKLVA